MDMSTRVSVRIADPATLNQIGNRNSIRSYNYYVEGELSHNPAIGDWIKSLMCCVDVDFQFSDARTGSAYRHSWNWTELPADQFLDELLARFRPSERAELIGTHAQRLTSLRDESGRVVGRAALASNPEGTSMGRYGVQVAVGGFVYPGTTVAIPAIGVVEGDTDVAARDRASARINEKSVKNWATEQAKLLDRAKFEYRRQMALGRTVLRLGGDSSDLPIIFSGTGTLTIGEFRKLLSENVELYVPLSEAYDGELRPWRIAEVPPSFFLHSVLPNVLVFPLDESPSGVGKELSRELKKDYPVDVTGRIDLLDLLGARHQFSGPQSAIQEIENAWGSDHRVEFCRKDLYAEALEGLRSEYWVFRLWRSGSPN